MKRWAARAADWRQMEVGEKDSFFFKLVKIKHSRTENLFAYTSDRNGNVMLFVNILSLWNMNVICYPKT
jgi:hypothetical protein